MEQRRRTMMSTSLPNICLSKNIVIIPSLGKNQTIVRNPPGTLLEITIEKYSEIPGVEPSGGKTTISVDDNNMRIIIPSNSIDLITLTNTYAGISSSFLYSSSLYYDNLVPSGYTVIQSDVMDGPR